MTELIRFPVQRNHRGFRFPPQLAWETLAGTAGHGNPASSAFRHVRSRKPASLAVALHCGMGSSSLNALVKAFDKLHSGFEVVQQIRPFNFGRPAILAVAVFVAVPILPLVLTMFSLRDLFARLLRVLL